MQISQRKNFSPNVSLFKILILAQLFMLVAISLQTRTPFIWVWAISSFVSPIVICILTDKERYVIPSLLLLFTSQHAIFVFSQSTWGYNCGSDPINDLHVATVLAEEAHFTLGQVGYISRLSYSYYPLLHVFAVTFSKLSGIPLNFIAVYFIPFINASLVCLLLYLLNKDFFGFHGRDRNLATLTFATCWYYTLFQSNFVRETFAFPFVLMFLLVLIRVVKRPYIGWAVLSPVIIAAVILSHHISSYMLLAIISVIVLNYLIFYRNNRLNNSYLLMAVMLFAYIAFVVTRTFSQQIIYFYEAFQEISMPSSVSVMKPYPTWRTYLTLSYYMLIAILASFGGLKLLKEWREKRHHEVLTLVTLFAFVFLLCALLRLSVSAHPWSWTYYTSLRGITWAFIGLSILLMLGLKSILKLNAHVTPKSLFVLSLIICLLAAGKFSQYPLRIDNPDIIPNVTFQRYMAALWLKNEAVHGFNMLVAPYTLDMEAFEGSRCMAPYAYLKEYFLDETQYENQYYKFIGYIPFIGGFFDRYKNSSSVSIIYSNGNVEIGYKSS
jgi:hypothetical protein